MAGRDARAACCGTTGGRRRQKVARSWRFWVSRSRASTSVTNARLRKLGSLARRHQDGRRGWRERSATAEQVRLALGRPDSGSATVTHGANLPAALAQFVLWQPSIRLSSSANLLLRQRSSKRPRFEFGIASFSCSRRCFKALPESRYILGRQSFRQGGWSERRPNSVSKHPGWPGYQRQISLRILISGDRFVTQWWAARGRLLHI